MSRALALVESSDDARSPHAPTASALPLLLETKLYVPRASAGLVTRPRLTAQLHASDDARLTVVIAPAGFGKTTLLAEWIAGRREAARVAWVSLDASENDPDLFWAYVIRGLQSAQAGVDAHSLVLETSRRERAEVVTALLNEIAQGDTDVVLVLDDYHVIDEPRVHAELALLLDRVPPRLRVVIASRSEPPLSLPRLRARGQLREIRATDLRFTSDEASAFLNQSMRLDLSSGDLDVITRRTEGWIAGLKLAALSMKAGDARRFVDAFSGEHRHIADYLVDEVLRSEPDAIRRFLLATSILGRLSGALCDAVTGEEGSQLVLEDLERRGLFVVPLDDRREWYRYHHLFADVLQRQAAGAGTDERRLCHQRASDWYMQRGMLRDAVHHALAANDSERAADLLERHWPEKDRSYESAHWLDQVKALPESAIRQRPVLCMGFAWGLLNSGELERADARLADVARALETPPTELVIRDTVRFQSLATELASARIYLAQSRGDSPATLEHATTALETIAEGDSAARATGIALVALAHWGRGELDAAHRVFSEALAAMRASGHDLDAIRGIFVLGDLRVTQGRLREGRATYERGLSLAAESVQFANAETDELHLGLAELHYEWNELDAARAHLDTIRRRESTSVHKGNMQRWCVDMCRMATADGDMIGALSFLDEAEQHERRDPVPRLRPISALRARLWLRQGNVDAALRWAHETSLTPDDALSFLREFEHITLARALIAHARSGAATAAPAAPGGAGVLSFIDRLSIAARTGRRVGSTIELLIVESLAHHAFGNARRALDPLAEAITLAEPEGYLRVFLDEGEPMRELLRTATARGLAGGYTRAILAGFERRAQSPVPVAPTAESAESAQTLTARELEILRLIAAGLRNQAIADHLSISGATVKRHIANAYGKLGVSHRTEALVRAAELKLL